MVKTFEEANRYVMSFIPKADEVKFAGQFGLDRQKYLLHLLDDPQDKFPCVHITGTSGKSSTSYLISSILKEAGY
ncbi:MAG: FolC bifunctional protein, partial [Microgenomates group bacterium GW2011_GWC1_39_12]